MGILAFLISIAYVPGFSGVSIPTGWAMMSLTLPLATWRSIPSTPFHVAGALFFAFAVVSLRWAPDFEFGIYHLWQLACIGGAFVLGSQIQDTRSIVIGLALGAGVSSAVSIVQAFGFEPVMRSYNFRSAGLFYNSVAMGSFAAFVLIWLCAKRMYWWCLLPLPALLLSYSRGAYAAVAFAAMLRIGWFGVILGLAVIGLFILDPQVVSNSVRVRLWWQAMQNLTWLGNGIGAIESVVLDINGAFYAPEYLHSEPLDFIFHYGLVAVLPLAMMFGLAFIRTREEWYPYVCFLFLGLYSFPLHVAPLAFAGAVCAGNLSRSWLVAWHDFSRRRLGLFSRPVAT